MPKYAFYDSVTGGITRTLVAPKEEIARQQGGTFLGCGSHVSDARHYVDLSGPEPVIQEKLVTDMSYIVSGLSVVFSGLPVGTTINVEGQEVVSDNDPTEIEFERQGTYRLHIVPATNYTDKILEVVING